MGPAGWDSGVRGELLVEGGRGQLSSRLRGEKVLLLVAAFLAGFLAEFEMWESKATGQALPPASPAPTAMNGTAPGPAYAGPGPVSFPNASQNMQFEQVVGSLQIYNYTIAAALLSQFLPWLPIGSTVFVPPNEAFLGVTTDPIALDAILSYHTVPQQLNSQQILALAVGTRMITLFPSQTILVTRAARDNFTLDNVRIVQMDICFSQGLHLEISCHGVETILNNTEWSWRTIPDPIGGPAPTPSLAPPTQPEDTDDNPVAGAIMYSTKARHVFFMFLLVVGCAAALLV